MEIVAEVASSCGERDHPGRQPGRGRSLVLEGAVGQPHTRAGAPPLAERPRHGTQTEGVERRRARSADEGHPEQAATHRFQAGGTVGDVGEIEQEPIACAAEATLVPQPPGIEHRDNQRARRRGGQRRRRPARRLTPASPLQHDGEDDDQEECRALVFEHRRRAGQQSDSGPPETFAGGRRGGPRRATRTQSPARKPGTTRSWPPANRNRASSSRTPATGVPPSRRPRCRGASARRRARGRWRRSAPPISRARARPGCCKRQGSRRLPGRCRRSPAACGPPRRGRAPRRVASRPRSSRKSPRHPRSPNGRTWARATGCRGGARGRGSRRGAVGGQGR